MNLGVSIANLLRRYPAVGVPGIGVFRKAHYPASYDVDKAVFLPPADYIELVDSDTDAFLLTTYLETQRQLDGYAATALLENAVKGIMDTISRNGEALLDGLGYLLADGASFIFKPFEIDGLAAKPIAAQPPAARISETGAPIDIPVEALVVSSGNTGGRRYTPWIIGGAVAAMVIAVAAVAVFTFKIEWLGSTRVEHATVPDNQVNLPAPSEEAIPLVEADQDSAVADTGFETVTVDSLPADSVSATSTPVAKPSVTYEIIVGSFATMRQADKFVAEMKAKGYSLHAIDSRMPGNRKKISWGSFATEEEAYKELARVQKTFEPGAWIAKIAHN